jgi:hypothetical protein
MIETVGGGTALVKRAAVAAVARRSRDDGPPSAPSGPIGASSTRSEVCTGILRSTPICNGRLWSGANAAATASSTSEHVGSPRDEPERTSTRSTDELGEVVVDGRFAFAKLIEEPEARHAPELASSAVVENVKAHPKSP